MMDVIRTQTSQIEKTDALIKSALNEDEIKPLQPWIQLLELGRSARSRSLLKQGLTCAISVISMLFQTGSAWLRVIMRVRESVKVGNDSWE